jgi:uncharacterized protein (DUF2237 family)
VRRHDKRKRRDQEELDARLDALGRPNPGGLRRTSRSKAGPTVFGILLVVAVLGAIYLIYTAAVGGDDARAQEGPVNVEVVKGDTLSDVADKLQAAGNKERLRLQAAGTLRGLRDADSDRTLHV